MVIVLMGAAGAGKTTVGRLLSEELHWVFLDGDAVHPPENIAKMRSGVPLSDQDRRPWLEALRRLIAEWVTQNINGVVASSLLKQAHRVTVLTGLDPHAKLVYLRASQQVLYERLTARTGHFAGSALLDSQLTDLDEPMDALVLDASQAPEQLVQIIRRTWNL
jgi:carbohydrate kinase (thermoresistant glucokinase family)